MYQFPLGTTFEPGCILHKFRQRSLLFSIQSFKILVYTWQIFDVNFVWNTPVPPDDHRDAMCVRIQGYIDMGKLVKMPASRYIENNQNNFSQEMSESLRGSVDRLPPGVTGRSWV